MSALKPPYTESSAGRLVELTPGKPALLLMGRGRLPPRSRLLGQDVTLAFGFRFLMSPETLIPQLVIDDFRREFNGRAAIDFMLNKGNSYPRADAIGMQLSNGARADLYMKEVDIADGLRAFAFAGELALPPLARVGAAAWLDAELAPEDGIVMREPDGSLLAAAVSCWRCHPSLAPAVLEWVRQAAKP